MKVVTNEVVGVSRKKGNEPIKIMLQHTNCKVCGKAMGTKRSDYSLTLQNEDVIGQMAFVFKGLQICDPCVAKLGNRFVEQFATIVQDMAPVRSVKGGEDDGLYLESVLFHLFANVEDFDV